MCVCVHVCVCMHVCVCACVCVCVCMCMCMCVCVCCTYIGVCEETFVSCYIYMCMCVGVCRDITLESFCFLEPSTCNLSFAPFTPDNAIVHLCNKYAYALLNNLGCRVFAGDVL